MNEININFVDSANTNIAFITGRTLNEIIRTCTNDYLDTLNRDNLPSPDVIENELIAIIKSQIVLENQVLPKGCKLSIPQKLCASQIATIMLFTHHIIRVKCGGDNADPSYDLLAIYCDTGDNSGLYITDEDEIKRVAHEYNYSISSRELSEVLELLNMQAPRVKRTTDKDLIAVNNGIFDYSTKVLELFSPEYVFLSKSRVNYNPAATNVTIHNDDDGTDWDVESWMEDLSDDPEIVELLWQILGAIIRPFVRWNKSAWFYSEKGNNGKGTLCELMRSLCGDGSYASISLEDFSKDFMLEPLIRANAVIQDENDVGTYIDKAANIKAVITNDVISINRKYKKPISYQFYGFVVECLNEKPKVKDKSDSFYRRQLFVPFEKCFTGKERKYIKDEYLHRTDVLEYVLYKVLNMNYYVLSEPQTCVTALAEFKEYNDPVRQFFEELSPQFVWDLLPFDFLFSLYKSWYRTNFPNGQILARDKFTDSIINVIEDCPEWSCEDKKRTIRPSNRMDKPERLIVSFGLDDWKNPTYTGGDVEKICTPVLKDHYRGLLRVSSKNGYGNDE